MSALHAQPPPSDRGGGLRPALAFAALAVLGCGLAFPLATAGLARVAFPFQAQGSLVVRDGRVVGSELVAQPFEGDRWFHPRPSACGQDPRTAAGSNLAQSNPALAERIAALSREVAQREGVAPADIPAELVMASGSGVDPHLSPEAALLQVPRVARARGLDEQAVRTLVLSRVEPATWGVLGRPRVNVLLLDLALEDLAAPSASPR